MVWREWKDLPAGMQTEEIRPYYEILDRKRNSLFMKHMFDMTAAFIMLAVLSPVFAVIAVMIKTDSKGPVFYRQERVTQYGKKFRIHKFRTMEEHADQKGTLVTVGNDSRITKAGHLLRDKRLDELPQLIDVLQGNMSFVGVRPEVPKYVRAYTQEMKATLLLPAGITNTASIHYRNEAELLEKAEDADRIYMEEILSEKMKWNLKELREYGFWREIGVMFKTVFFICRKNTGEI